MFVQVSIRKSVKVRKLMQGRIFGRTIAMVDQTTFIEFRNLVRSIYDILKEDQH